MLNLNPDGLTAAPYYPQHECEKQEGWPGAALLKSLLTLNVGIENMNTGLTLLLCVLGQDNSVSIMLSGINLLGEACWASAELLPTCLCAMYPVSSIFPLSQLQPAVMD